MTPKPEIVPTGTAIVNEKTIVEIFIDDQLKYILTIKKQNVNLNEILLKLRSQHKRFKDFNGHYDYDFKRKENGEDVIVEIDEDDHTENLPLCDGKVILQCWTKSL